MDAIFYAKLFLIGSFNLPFRDFRLFNAAFDKDAVLLLILHFDWLAESYLIEDITLARSAGIITSLFHILGQEHFLVQIFLKAKHVLVTVP